MRSDFQRFFRPAAIAVIGASRDLDTISGQPLKFLQAHGYRGRLYPVNPRYADVLGYRCYPSVTELPEAPDLALVVVGATRVAEVLRQCGEKGVPYAIVYSSGFAEMGGEGEARQRELAAIAARYGIGLVGPNCQGMINAADRVYAGFGSVYNQDYEPGRVSMVSQSGGFGMAVMNLSSKEGRLPFRYMVTTGNEAGLSSLDFIDYYVDDPGTELIVAYIEGLKDAARLVEVGEKALAAGKPLLMWKVGNSETGRAAARAHTANPGGEAALYRGAFRQAGILEVEDIQDVVDYGRAFGCGRLPRGNRLAIVTITGGGGILMTDECIARGMRLPRLAPHTVEQLRAFVPPYGSLLNPVDVTAAIFNDPELIHRTMQAIVDDPNVDCLAMINASLQAELAARVAAQICAVTARTDKPVLAAWSAREAVAAEAYAMLDAARIPHYRSPVRCGRAIAALSAFAAARERAQARRAEAPLVLERPEARAALAGARGRLGARAAKRVLAEYGIAATREELAGSVHEARAIARAIGYPLELEVCSPDLAHETPRRALRLEVGCEAELAPAYEEVLAKACAYDKNARIEGVLVRERRKEAAEVSLGVVDDPSFGPVVRFGLGGRLAAALHEVSFRLVPVRRSVAREMVEELRGDRVLAGAGGRSPADVEALVEAIVRLAAAAADLRGVLAELAIDPLLVLAPGEGVRAADAWIEPARK